MISLIASTQAKNTANVLAETPFRVQLLYFIHNTYRAVSEEDIRENSFRDKKLF